MKPWFASINGWIVATMTLALLVIVVGAFTRLTDAGLGCPDWPGCYGYATPIQAKANQAVAEARFPERPLEVAKAWAEMGHRYIASILGLLIIIIAVKSWSTPQRGHGLALFALVLFQGALGMWTVTLNLMPVIVMGHLLGGFSLFCLLGLLWLRRQSLPRLGFLGSRLAVVALLALVVQIALGGWTSANYAALACTEFPLCEPGWQERLDFAAGFQPIQPPAHSYEFGTLDWAARMTIHVSHRIWAVVTALLLLTLAFKLWRHQRQLAGALALLTLVQVGLGLANVVWQLPLAIAVAHNGVAALLLLTTVAVNYRIWVSVSETSAQLKEAEC
ncbi:COX15/CtaA family protein [Ferrimonas aestuarii]|nr:COX15/CtaA family protein [Ferrimonas aestuarii]